MRDRSCGGVLAAVPMELALVVSTDDGENPLGGLAAHRRRGCRGSRAGRAEGGQVGVAGAPGRFHRWPASQASRRARSSLTCVDVAYPPCSHMSTLADSARQTLGLMTGRMAARRTSGSAECGEYVFVVGVATGGRLLGARVKTGDETSVPKS